jgi:plastocyanin
VRAGPGVAACVAVVLLLGGCAIWGPEGGPGGAGLAAPSPGVAASAEVGQDAVTGTDGVQRVVINVTDTLTFEPSLVRAHPGIIEFTIHNVGLTPHSVTLDLPSPASPPVDTDQPTTGNLNGGATAVIRVTVTTPGRYPYPCLYHVTSGMRGYLDVT